jgi:rhomboid-like protein
LEDDTYYPSSLPSGPLPQDTVERLFPTLHPIDGNRILSILHTRRLTGSLSERGISGVDDAMNVDLSDISPEQFMKALEYLRASFPVDEEAAAVDWAEAEAGRIEREILSERGVKLGLLKKVEPNPETEEQEKRGEEWEGQRFITVKAREAREAQLGAVGGQGTEYGREKYGRSVFETLRKSNEANWEAEKAEKERIKLEEEAKMVAEGRDKGPQDLVPKKRFLGVEIRGTFRTFRCGTRCNF